MIQEDHTGTFKITPTTVASNPQGLNTSPHAILKHENTILYAHPVLTKKIAFCYKKGVLKAAIVSPRGAAHSAVAAAEA